MIRWKRVYAKSFEHFLLLEPLDSIYIILYVIDIDHSENSKTVITVFMQIKSSLLNSVQLGWY